MYFGADYYPEHWSSEQREKDYQLMKEMGLEVVRMGEFAWNIFEKEEGVYDFSFFDEVIQKLYAFGIKTILGTPTATPPAWLCTKHPDILSVDRDGQVRSFGSRRHYCTSSSTYHQYTQKIVEAMSMHYKDHPAVIGWQVDNEIGHEGSDLCYCTQCREGFQEWLKQKYKTIDELNDVWGTVFWSQTYGDFSEIPLPVKTTVMHNPSLELDYYRFRSDSMVCYGALQVQIIRTIVGEKPFITTNLYPGFTGKALNHDDLMQTMDFVSYDNYPVWGGLPEPVPASATAMCLDFMRGIKNKNFWIMEQLSGAQGHNIMGYLPKPGQVKLWTYQAIGRGAESIVYFRWRSARFGTEEFCHGILDHDSIPRRKYMEIKELIEEMKEIREDFITQPVVADAAVLYDWDNFWTWKVQPMSSAMNVEEEMHKFYFPLHFWNVATDVISVGKEIDAYKVVVAPILTLSDVTTAQKLIQYIHSGGTVIFTYRTGVKLESNAVTPKTLPGDYAQVVGFEIYEYESLQTGQRVGVKGIDGMIKGTETTGTVWCDLIEPKGAQVLAEYTEGYYKDKAAITVHEYGKGKAYYIGTSVEPDFLLPLYKSILDEAQVVHEQTEPGVEILRRQGKEKDLTFVLNHSAESRKYKDLTLEPYASKIIL